MTIKRSFPFAGRTGKRSLPEETAADFIERLPLSAVLVDERSGRIEAANPLFCQATGLTMAEAVGRELDGLLPGWENGSAPLIAAAGANGRPDAAAPRTVPLARILAFPAAPKGKRALVIHTPGPKEQSASGEAGFQGFWNSLAALAASLQPADLEAGLAAALEAARKLTGAEMAAIYRLESGRPQLARCAGSGEMEALPETLSAQEMIPLNRPVVWKSGKRAGGALHRQARSASLAYLLSAPCSDGRATVGLVVIGGRRPAPVWPGRTESDPQPEATLPAAELLAATVTALFTRHARDISRLAQIEAYERRMRLKAALEERTREGMLALDAGLHIMRINSAAAEMLGYEGKGISGRPVEEVLIGPEALGAALKAAAGGSPTYRMDEVYIYRRNGEAFPAAVRIFPVRHGEQVEHVLVLLEDQSEIERTRSRETQLEQHASLGELTAVFAHEVRNPINNISTGLQLMATNLDPEDPNQAVITRIMQDCDRLSELMRSVLAFSRPVEYQMVPLDLGALVRRLLERQQNRITKNNVQASLRVDDTCPAVSGDAKALEQVFTNLINNAVQAMTGGGHLILKIGPVQVDGSDLVEVSVADTGPGISPESQDKVFQPFFTTEKNGTGLGLPIVKRILTAHKGSIHLTSFPGGTIFRVRLPALPVESEEGS